MKLKIRKNKKKRDVWYCEWWEGRKHQTQVLGYASGVNALSRKQASLLLSKFAMEIESARESRATSGLSGFSSVEAAANLWFENQSRVQDWAAYTKYSFRSQLATKILPAIGSMQLRDVRNRHIEALFVALAEQGYAYNTVLQTRAAISSMFRWLARQDIDIRYIRPRLPRTLRPPKETALLSDHQIEAVMEAPGWIGTALRMMLLCGLRPGELLALRYSDIRPDGEVLVSRAVKPDGISGTKGRRARVVHVPSGLQAEIAALGGSGDDLLFARGGGAPLSTAKLRSLIEVLPRQFRTTFATLVEMDITGVQQALGHSSAKTTRDHYVKPAKKNARAVEALERKLRTPRAPRKKTA